MIKLGLSGVIIQSANSGDFMVKKTLIIFLILSALVATSLSVCVGDDSTSTDSIYNSTSANSIYNSTSADSAKDSASDKSADDSTVSEYNSTNKTNDIPTGEKEKFLESVEYTKVPINEAYSKDKLQEINVSDDILEAFSRFELWLDKQNVDTKAEDMNIMYVDDDLKVIENYWVFATRPESKERNMGMVQNSKSTDPSPDEMAAFLKKFDEKYPAKYVRTGVVLFITIENKDSLLSEITEEDIQMLNSISDVIINESSMKRNEVITSNWGSSNPNLHADMSRWAAEKAGFDSYYANIISNNAAEPDNISFIDLIDAPNIIASAVPPGYVINGIFVTTAEYIYLKNYNHYYNPTALNGAGFGGAPSSIEREFNGISAAGSKEEKTKHLSYASHYMADMSMPLHTNKAVNQTTSGLVWGLVYGQPHFVYENDYVGANWTTGHNFSQYAKNVDSSYIIHDPGLQSKALANFAYGYSEEAWECGVNLNSNSSYTPSLIEYHATQYSIEEGQKYLNGLMQKGYQQIFGFTNQQDITLQLSQDGLRVNELDLTNLRVSMGAGDSARIYLNGREILRFVDSGAGGNLYIYNETGSQLGNISKVNGKTNYENMTFDVSFIHDGPRMNIIIQKYYRGALNGTFTYSYMTNNDMLTMRANMTGYQSNVDYISSQYEIFYEGSSSATYQDGSFVNQQNITVQLARNGVRVEELDLTNLRVSMGAGDIGRIYINNREILKFVDSSAGGNLYIYNENGNQLGNIPTINGKPTYENMTFDVSFVHDGSRMNIKIQKYHRGILNSTYNYSYVTTSDMSTMRANMAGYQSNVDYISSQYRIYYES